LPLDKKICSYDCIYCECGWTDSFFIEKSEFPSVELVKMQLAKKLEAMQQAGEQLDVITFAGNGEPTLHPFFAQIVDVTIELRNEFYPDAAITVLTNATILAKQEVKDALMKIENPILKLDAAVEETYKKINLPKGNITLDKIIDNIKSFQGPKIIQTLFLRGDYKGEPIDNTTDEEVDALIRVMKEIEPQKIMIYPIDRETPASGLQKISKEELTKIADKLAVLGVEVQVVG